MKTIKAMARGSAPEGPVYRVDLVTPEQAREEMRSLWKTRGKRAGKGRVFLNNRRAYGFIGEQCKRLPKWVFRVHALSPKGIGLAAARSKQKPTLFSLWHSLMREQMDLGVAMFAREFQSDGWYGNGDCVFVYQRIDSPSPRNGRVELTAYYADSAPSIEGLAKRMRKAARLGLAARV